MLDDAATVRGVLGGLQRLMQLIRDAGNAIRRQAQLGPTRVRPTLCYAGLSPEHSSTIGEAVNHADLVVIGSGQRGVPPVELYSPYSCMC